MNLPFVINTKNELESEMAQRIAFTFGYRWQRGGETPSHCDSKCLHFYPIDKRITYGYEYVSVGSSYNSHVIIGMDELVECLKKPPGISVGVATIYKNRDVVIGGVRMTGEEFNTIVGERFKYLSE